MIFIPGYSVIDTLEENSTRLYKSHRSKDNTDVLIKVVKRQDTKLAHQLEHEFDLTSKITPLDALKASGIGKNRRPVSLNL